MFGVLVLWCLHCLPERLIGAYAMVRLTISLADLTHRALKEAAVRQNRSMASIIEESLKLRGLQPLDSAREIVAKARARSRLDADQAMVLAVKETRRSRKGR